MDGQLKQALEAFRSGDLDRALALAEAELSGASSPQAHHLLGLVHCRLGDFGQGVDHLRIAADAEPRNSAFRIMLVRALVDAGRATEVLDMPAPSEIRSAAELELWRVRGEAAAAAGSPEQAAEAWRRVAAAAPNDWRAWGNLASALASQRRWPEAVDAFANAVRLNASEPSLRLSLAGALAAANRHEDALSSVLQAEQVSGPTAESAIMRGRCFLSLARFEESEAAYRESLELSPGSRDSFHELGLLFERTGRLASLAELLGQAAAAGVDSGDLAYLHALQAFREGRIEEADALLESVEPDEDPLRWYRLEAKLADRLGKSAEAFAAASAMNRLTPDFEEWRKRGLDYRERLRSLGRSLGEISELPRLGEPDRRMPAFLVGFPRSGTTLLDTFLLGHPDIAVLEEEHLLDAAERQIGRVAELGSASRASIERARKAYLTEMDRHVAGGFRGLVVDKLPLNLLGAPFIQAMFPGAPIIFAQRHPCDAVLSGVMQSFVMNDAMASFLTIEDAADLYDAVMSGWRTIRERFDLPVHSVTYEKLVENPEAELRPLVAFLGLEWDDRLLAHTETAKARGAISTPSYDQVTEPLDSRPVGRWRRYEEQLRPVLPVLLPWAEWLGYRD